MRACVSANVYQQHKYLYLIYMTTSRPTFYLVLFFCPSSAADPPSDITATRDPPTATSITVSWSVPSTGATPTGYIIHYQADGDAGSMTINSGATTTAVIAVLSTELVYDITMQTLSTMLPSAWSSTITSGSEWLP